MEANYESYYSHSLNFPYFTISGGLTSLGLFRRFWLLSSGFSRFSSYNSSDIDISGENLTFYGHAGIIKVIKQHYFPKNI